mgnify:FL=1
MDEAKRRHILHTAMKLFNEYGFHATPTSKIAKKSKISVGTLFNYFPTKEALIQEIYIHVKIHSRKVFIQQLEENFSEHDNLKSMWRTVIKWGIDNPEEFHYLELFCSSPFKKEFKHEKAMDAYKQFRQTILASISPSTICKEYPEYSMIYIDNAIHAATKFILESDEVSDIDHFIDSSFELVWKGFRQ